MILTIIIVGLCIIAISVYAKYLDKKLKKDIQELLIDLKKRGK